MALTFNDLTDLIREEVNLGNELDALIPIRIRQNIRAFEKRMTPAFQYMRNSITNLTFTEGDTSEPLANFAPGGDISLLKDVGMIRLDINEGQNIPMGDGRPRFHYIRKIDPLDVYKLDQQPIWPNGFWYESINNVPTNLVFDRPIPQTITPYVVANWYTDPAVITGNGGNNNHWLLDNAEMALLYATVISFGTRIRDPDLMKTYAALFEVEWDNLMNAVEEFDYDKSEMYMEPDRGRAGG